MKARTYTKVFVCTITVFALAMAGCGDGVIESIDIDRTGAKGGGDDPPRPINPNVGQLTRIVDPSGSTTLYHDEDGNVVKREKIIDGKIVLFRPYMIAVSRFNQLRCNPHTLTHLAYATLNEIGNTQIFTDLPNVYMTSFKGETRIP